MSREEIVQLLNLLNLYEKECEAEQKTYMECESKQELATQIMIAEHIKVVKEIKEVLCFKF